MAFDGVFIHFLIDEIKPQIINKRINKIISINDAEHILVLQNKLKLFLSANSNNPHFRLSNLEFLNNNTSLSTFLKKHVEGGIINDLKQYNNDRIIIIDLSNKDDLGYSKNYKLIFELTGRNANIIITDQDYKILEALKKTYLTDERVIQVKAPYQFLESNKENPFEVNEIPNNNDFEGVSKLLFNEFNFQGSVTEVLNRPIKPTIMKQGNKTFFYVFDFKHLEGEKLEFPTISEMLEYYYVNLTHEITQSNEQKQLHNYINKEIAKLNNKLSKQIIELEQAYGNLDLEKTANILAANIHLVKAYQEEITVDDFYTNEKITIKLNTNIKPRDNINYYFNKYKKAKRTIVNLQETIDKTKDDITYHECLLNQSDLSSASDLREILTEVGISKAPKRKTKPNLLKYSDDLGNQVFVGKNNLQNDYLTHTFANSNDYFFHVVAYPGSHVILRGELNEETIKLASTIAAYYSRAKGSVSVDYTLVKWVKKVKGMKGSFVTYTNQKTTHATPDLGLINKLTNPDK